MMNSRAKILAKLKGSEMPATGTKEYTFEPAFPGEPVQKFKELIELLHGTVIEINTANEIADYIQKHFAGKRIVSQTQYPELDTGQSWFATPPQDLENVEFALLQTKLAVAENGAVWLSDEQVGQRVAPFICQQLGIIVQKADIVPTMVQAYERLEGLQSGYGVFIAGPSKTADIEQSLVTGAHGPRNIHIFLL